MHGFSYKQGTLKRVILIFLAVAVISICVALALAYFLPKTPRLKDGDVTIGGTTITQKQLNAYAKGIEDYRKANPKEIISGDAKAIASDDLIMNAALKQYAKQYKVTINNKDILASAGIDVATNEQANAVIDSQLGGVNSLERIRNENATYEDKLSNHVLAIKSLFVVQTSFDTPYFNGLVKDKVQSAYDVAKAKLQDKYLPLFKSKLSKEDIAKKADVNFLDDNATDDGNSQQYFEGSVVGASFDEGYRADGQYYNNLDTTDYIRGNVGKLYSMDEKIATLKNVGDYTDVFAAKTGTFSIVRLEAKTNGQFNSWSDMLESFKRKYAYDGISTVVSDVSYGTQTLVEKATKAVANFGIEPAYARSICSGHDITYYVYSWNITSKLRIGGTKIRLKSAGTNACYGRVNTVLETEAGHNVTQNYNCYGVHMDFQTVSTAIPGYHYTGRITSPHPEYLENSSGHYMHNNHSGQHSGFPHWQGYKTNTLGHVYINYLYTKPKPPAPPPAKPPTSDVNVCHPMRYSVSPGTDYDGNGIGVDVYIDEVRQAPTYYVASGAVDVTGQYTDGNTHTVLYNEPLDWTSWYITYENGAPIYGEDGITVIGYEQVLDFDYPDWGRASTWYETIGPCYNYQLTASVASFNPHDSLVDVNPGVTSTKAPDPNHAGDLIPTPQTISKPTKWQITQLVFGPTKPVPTLSNASNDDEPCDYFESDSIKASCTAISPEGANAVFKTDGTVLSGDNPYTAIHDTPVDEIPPGSKVCYAFSVQPRAAWYTADSDHTNDQWNHSALSLTNNCTTVVGRAPKVQVLGGDLSVGKVFTGASVVSNVDTSITEKSNTSFGSWVEYAIFATGTIHGAASASGLAGGLLNAESSGCNYSLLSFTNATEAASSIDCPPSTGAMGGYTIVRPIPDVEGAFPGGTPITVAEIVPSEMTSGTYTYDGNLTLKDSVLDPDKELAPGTSIILKVNGTVSITANQTYSDDNIDVGYTKISQLPQLIIIAKEINIDEGVTYIDAWLIAKSGDGIINTCSTVPLADPLADDICNQQLIVNGPVMAKKLYLRRTAGSGTGEAADDPAEIFNLRPDAYLWGYSRVSGSSKMHTVYEINLPPRL